MILIIGAGLAGLSMAYHLKDEENIIIEANSYAGGHIYSEKKNGFTWDEGPHVSFTKNDYVRRFLEENTGTPLLQYPVTIYNYYKGNWIPHPVQTNMYALPDDLKEECLKSFNNQRSLQSDCLAYDNYADWLISSFGSVFSEYFPFTYTKKYWTINADRLSTDWIGERVYLPSYEKILESFLRPSDENKHYIDVVRYPTEGGFISFGKKMIDAANIRFNSKVNKIDLNKKLVYLNNGTEVLKYDVLVNTIPIPDFIKICSAPQNILEESSKLNCTSVLIFNIAVNHEIQKKFNWFYVYDEDKYSTRINFTELLSPNNAPKGKCGIQVEVYFSKYLPLHESIKKIGEKVCDEIIEMGILKSKEHIESIDHKIIERANVIFDTERKKAQNEVLNWLHKYGLEREEDDLNPVTNWEQKFDEKSNLGEIILAGRYAQWKYYWTDDCILRGKYICERLKLNQKK